MVVLSVVGAFGGPPVSEAVLTGLIGLAGGFAMGRVERGP
jgi:hypothetical protein